MASEGFKDVVVMLLTASRGPRRRKGLVLLSDLEERLLSDAVTVCVCVCVCAAAH